MIDYSTWQRKKLSVVNLKLDDQNPRLPGLSSSQRPTQPKIIEYLIEHEDVFELAKTIATQGYLPNEEPIVCKENNKLVVLEGNRRITACKLLINPNLITSKSKRKTLTEILLGFDLSVITKLEVRIAPDRDSADVLIVNRHTDGAAIERWDKTKQDRFFYNRVVGGESIEDLSLKFNIRKAVIKETIIRYNMYNELLKIPLESNDMKDVQDETKFAMTNVERFYNSKLGKEFLGITFNDTGIPAHTLPKDEYIKRLKQITLDVLSKKLNSRTYGDEQDQTKYLKSLKDSNAFNLDVTPNKNYESEYEAKYENVKNEDLVETKPEIKAKIVIKQTPANKLISTNCNLITNISRIDSIFKELKSANLDNQFNSAAVLFRSYLDMIVHQFLKKTENIEDILKEEQQKFDLEFQKRKSKILEYIKSLNVVESSINENAFVKALGGKPGIKKNWIPTLKQMLVFISKSDTLLPDIKLRQALTSYVKGNSSYLDHNDFNLLVHNEYYIKSTKDLKEAWDQVFPFITYIIQQLNK